MNEENKLTTWEKIAIALGIVGAGAGIYAGVKVNRMCKTLNCTIKDLSNNVNIDVDKRIVDKVVEQQAKIAYADALQNASEAAVALVANDIHSTVNKAVAEAYSDCRDSVEKELYRQVNKLDIVEIQSKVVKQTQRQLEETFQKQLDTELLKFNNNLDNVGKIYKSIADNMSGNKTTIA